MVGNADDRPQHARLFHPGNASHLAVSVKGEAAAEGVVVPYLALTRNNYCDPGPGDVGVIVSEGGVTYQSAGHVGDSAVLPSRHAADGKAEVS